MLLVGLIVGFLLGVFVTLSIVFLFALASVHEMGRTQSKGGQHQWKLLGRTERVM